MRPQRIAAENRGYTGSDRRDPRRFNEAAADRCGKLDYLKRAKALADELQ